MREFLLFLSGLVLISTINLVCTSVQAQFAEPTLFYIPENMPPPDGFEAVEVADLNGDNFEDIIFKNGWQRQIGWIENTGEGTFEDIRIIMEITGGGSFLSPTLGDLDGDQDIDIIVFTLQNFNLEDDSIIWLINDGEGNFTQQIIAEQPHNSLSHKAVILDLNQDGRNDIVYSFPSHLEWLENLVPYKFADSMPKLT